MMKSDSLAPANTAVGGAVAVEGSGEEELRSITSFTSLFGRPRLLPNGGRCSPPTSPCDGNRPPPRGVAIGGAAWCRGKVKNRGGPRSYNSLGVVSQSCPLNPRCGIV